jgi:citrate synthase
MSETVKFSYGGKDFELPIIEGTENEKAIDIAKLRAQTGLITIDPGFKNTGSTTSSITFLDGELGVLRYRGYNIEELAEKSTFLEVAYLLIYGDLPTQGQYEKFTREITTHTLVHEDIKKILEGFPSNAHPMGVLSSLICSSVFSGRITTSFIS